MTEGAYLAAVSSVAALEGDLPATVRVLPVGAPDMVCGPLPVFESLRGPMAADRSGLFVCQGTPGGIGVVLCRADGTVGGQG